MIFIHNHIKQAISLILIGFLLLLTQSVQAGIEDAYDKWTGVSLNPSATFSTEDLRWPLSYDPTVFHNQSCDNQIIFGIDLDANLTAFTSIHYWEIDINLTPYSSTGVAGQIVSKTLKINYDPRPGKQFTAKSYYHFTDGYKVDIEVTDFREGANAGNMNSISTVPDYFYLEAKTFVDRVFVFDKNIAPTWSATYPKIDPSEGLINLKWLTVDGAESYDLEWTYVDNYSHTFGTQIPDTDIFYDFGKDATRINVQGDVYNLNNVYDKGLVLVRIRAVGKNLANPSQRQEGNWNIPTSGTVGNLTGATSYVAIVNPHVATLNWQYSSVFAEEGKNKASVAYFDDGLKTRQAVTRISTENLVLIGESIYDAQGRPAITVMPSPTPAKDSKLQYYLGMTVNSSGQPYSWQDFDIDDPNQAYQVIHPDQVSNFNGAGRYYSSNNSDKEGAQANVPDAEGYPFSQVRFTPDNTGRISLQASPGETHRMGSGHEVKIYYPDVSQEEIDQRFGTEAGYAVRHKKTVTVDPNGQINIGEVNASGQTIYTSMAGKSPDNLQALDSNQDPNIPTTTINLNNFNKPLEPTPHGFESLMNHMVTTGGDHTLVYTLEGAVYDEAIDGCLNTGVCFDCVYDLSISIIDDCGQEMMPGGNPIKQTIPSLAELDANCGDPTFYDISDPTQVLVNLPVGQYTITKRLTINDDAMDYYLEQYLDPSINTCIKPLQEFIDEFEAKIDYSSCNIDYCTFECVEKIGSYAQYFEELQANSSITLDSADQQHKDAYNTAINNCKDECEAFNTCDALLSRLKADVSPGGKYAVDDSDPNSLLNTTTASPYLGVGTAYSSVVTNDPYDYKNDAITYLDLDGNIAQVNGLDPQDLDYATFVANWQESWADELVKFHPEYCKYEFCLLMKSSAQFDYDLLQIDSYSEALAKGYIFPNPGSFDIFRNKYNPHDPFFLSGNPGGIAGYDVEMENLLTGSNFFSFGGLSFSLTDLAIMLTYCYDPNGSNNIQAMFNCMQGYDPNLYCNEEDQVWFYYRTLYLSQKHQFIAELKADQDCYKLVLPVAASDPDLNELMGGVEVITASGQINDPQIIWNQATAISNPTALKDDCEETCDSYVDYWFSVIGDCIDPADKQELEEALLAICKSDCDNPLMTNMLGVSNNPAGVDVTFGGITTTYFSFEEALDLIAGVTSDPIDSNFDPYCNAHLITMPPAMDQSISGASQTFPIMDQCACDAVLQSDADFAIADAGGTLPDGVTTAEEFFAYNEGFTMVNYSGTICKCTNAYELDNPSVSWPNGSWGTLGMDDLVDKAILTNGEIACPECAPCGEIIDLFDNYWDDYAPHQNNVTLFENFANKKLGYNLSFEDYETFYDECVAAIDPLLCGPDKYATDLNLWLNDLIPGDGLTARNLDISGYSNFTNSQVLNTTTTTPFYDAEVVFSRDFDHEFYIVDNTDEGGLIYAGKTATDKLVIAKQNPDDSWGFGGATGTAAITVDISSLYSGWTYNWNSLQILETQNSPTPGFVVSGLISDGTDQHLLVQKIKADGTQEWTRKISDANYAQQLMGLVERPDGRLVMSYYGTPTDVNWNQSTYVVILTESGSLEAEQKFENLGDNIHKLNQSNPYFKHLALADGNNVYLAAMSGDEDGLAILKLNSSGIPISNQNSGWDNMVFTNIPLYCSANTFTIESTTDHGLVVVIKDEDIPSAPKTRIFKLDVDGSIDSQIQDELNLAQNGVGLEITSLARTLEGGFMLAGIYPSGGISTAALFVFDQNGDLEEKILQSEPQTIAMALARDIGHYLMLESYDKAENFIKDGTSLLSVCNNTVINPSIISFPVSSATKSFIPIDPNLTFLLPAGPTLSTTNPSFTESCGEILLVHITDANGADCKIRLDIPAGMFINFSSVSNPVATGSNTFTLTADYTQGGTTYQTTVTGTADCMGICDVPGLTLCNEPLFEEILIEDDCEKHLLELAYYNATVAYEEQIKALTDQFQEDYLAHCLGNFTEEYKMSYQDNQYHTTLYYYDQAGSLIQTVPPAGVDLLSQANTNLVDLYRKTNNSTPVLPAHSKKTKYQYNSLSQLVWQNTPDGNESRFWYDGLGRLVVSQNAEQEKDTQTELDDWYSYIKYDALGRAVEAGEIKQTTPMDQTTSMDQTLLTNWLTATPKREQTFTTYDFPYSPDINTQFSGGQQNLRGRVASVHYKDEDPRKDAASHYSYDIHGNVDVMIQEFPSLDQFGPEHQYKIFEYKYDLVSGNVHEVAYQKDKADALYHRYYYDADNRLIDVETSTDYIFWQKEANYAYYDHGPLARVELGDQKVQGIDYAYTIQGWIKGMNSNSLNMDHDMGKDGKPGINYDGQSHELFAKDAFGFTLGYFNGDYKAIDANASFEADPSSIYNAGAKSLFNGNINHMTVALPGMNDQTTNVMAQLDKKAYIFEYDQLQRIKQMRAYKDVNNLSGNNWNSILSNQDHDTDYAFDADGNLTSLIRNGTAASGHQEMDDLTYTYEEDQNGNQISNRLLSVTDNSTAPSTAYDNDIEGTRNYTYDDIGNLIQTVDPDPANGFTETIEWAASGKIKEINRDNQSATHPNLAFRYDAGGNRIVKIVKPTNQEEDWVYTYYVRSPQGDVISTYKRYFTNSADLHQEGFDEYQISPAGQFADILILEEQHLYGSKRLGVKSQPKPLKVLAFDNTTGYDQNGFFQPTNTITVASNPVGDPDIHSLELGSTFFELSDHRGNVQVTISDRKLQAGLAVGNLPVFQADIRSSQDYYPYGMEMPDRKLSVSGYRFGFQGQETDDELNGKGNAVSYKYRIHDPRIGRFLSVDPLAPEYPYNSQYAFSENRVIDAIELEGLESQTIHTPHNRPAQIEENAQIYTSEKGEDGNVLVNSFIVTRNDEPFVFIYNGANGSYYNSNGQAYANRGEKFAPYLQATVNRRIENLASFGRAEGRADFWNNIKSIPSNLWNTVQYVNSPVGQVIMYLQTKSFFSQDAGTIADKSAAGLYNGTNSFSDGYIVGAGLGAIYKGIKLSLGTRSLYHYTNEKGMNGILKDKKLNPSTKANNPKDVRYGDGFYLSDIKPGTKSPAQLARSFINVPNKYKYTHFIEIRVNRLNVNMGRKGVFYINGTKPLNLKGRIIDHGPVIKK